ncbi:MAG: OmpA family protein [Deltaproteobacteria bacterium]
MTNANDGSVTVKESVEEQPSVSPGTSDLRIGDRDTERLTSSAFGPIGIYKIEAADIGAPELLRLGLYGQYFTQGNFPVLQSNEERAIGLLTLAYAPLKFLEVYGGTQEASNNATGPAGTSPSYLGEEGDFWVGAKVGFLVTGGLSLGGDLRIDGYSSVGASGLGAGTVQPTLLATYDALRVSRVPLRLHLNAGGLFGNLGNLTATNAQGQPVSLRAAEQFALGYTPYNQVHLGLGIEAPLPFVTPFLEYETFLPLGESGLTAPCGAPSTNCPTLSYLSTMPNDLDFGARVTALRDVSFLAAVDVGLQRYVALGVPIVPPWEAFLGVSYNWDPLWRGEVKTVERTRTVEKKVAEELPGQVIGTVLDQDGRPVAHALVTVDGSDLPPVATNSAEGLFHSYRLPDGPVSLTVAKDGYETLQAQATVEKGKVARLSLTLKEKPHPASLKVTVHDAKDHPVAATVTVEGPGGYRQDLSVPASGELEAPLPKPGSYALRVEAGGFLGRVGKVNAQAGQPTAADFALQRAPKRTLLVITSKKILLKKQIHFENNKATILPDSNAILAQVVDALVKHHVEKVRIEGHTDNVGNKTHNLALSQERANAVMQYLIDAGIPADKLEAVGYGDAKPVAPNVTARGRALNRRVEFDLL